LVLKNYANKSTLIVINNKLREVYGNLGFKAGFSKRMKFWQQPQEELLKLTHHYTQNIDLRDAKPFCIIAEQLYGIICFFW
jgi:hypothetical protein